MSSDSDNEEFFDTFDTTPAKIVQSINENYDIPLRVDTFIPPQNVDTLSNMHLSPSKYSQNVSTKVPWRSHTTSPLPPLTSPTSLSSKLASSLPTLHIQDTASRILHTQNSAQSLLMTLDLTFSKETDSQTMPPPKDLPLLKPTIQLFDQANLSKADVEENASICSGSLLGTLSINEEDNTTQSVPPWRGRRARHRDRRNKMQDDDDDNNSNFPPSPGESQSSSVDAIFPSNHSAPFRVVEFDATSIYSTTFTQDKGNKPASGFKIEAKEDINVTEKILKTNAGLQDKFIPDSQDSGLVSALPLSPEPDIIASTKSNSLPRNEDHHRLPTVDFSLNRIASVSESILSAIDKDISSSVVPDNPSINTCALVKEERVIKSDDINIFSAIPVPVAPPRKNRKRKKNKDDDSISTSSVSSLPIPALSITQQDFDTVSNSLDIQSAVRGEYIVRPQDTASSRAPGPSETDLSRIESTGDTTSQASTPETSRMTSSRRFSPSDILSSNKQDFLPSSLNVPLPESAGPESTGIKELTDEEILSQVTVLNLDTGESIPLSKAEECLPSALNPLSLHIMRLTSEYIGSSLEVDQESDEESITDTVVRKLPEFDTTSMKKKTSQIKKFFGKTMGSAVNKAKNLAQEVSQRGKEEKDIFEDDAPAQNIMQYVKIKTSHSHKGPVEFDNLMYVQELKGEHTGPVWCMKFSPCGRLLATAGQDHVLRVWVLKQAFNYFLDIRTKWNADVKSSPTPSQESLVSQQSSHSSEDFGTLDPNDDGQAPFMPKPFCVYSGHTADVLDLSWSKNYFMLTSSMDKTVRLWHISRKECLCIFKHVDFVTAIAFHPKDDRYFISGSLDGKLRLWSIPDKQVVMWNEVEGHPKLITAANFCQNGAFTVVGTYNGRCIFYKTEELKYYTQIHVKSSRGKNARGGRKITGIEPLPDENKLLITSNDSRIRLYNLGVLNVCCKYKGCSNFSSQIKAGLSHDGKFIVCGSENQCIYIWKTNHDYSKFSSARKDRNIYWEGVKAHSAVVTCAIFSPRPEHVFNFIEQQETQKKEKAEKDLKAKKTKETAASNHESATSNKGYVLVSADFNGCIKIFLKKEKPKHSSLPASALA